MIKKQYIFGIALALFVLATSLSGCISTPENEESTTIVCTNSMLADFSSHLLNNTKNITIDYIMPAGACPAHFDARPSDVSLISSADIIISLGWEPWLDSLLESSGNTDATQIKCGDIGDWNIPSEAANYVEKLRDELSSSLSSYNETILENAQSYLADINQTANQLQENMTNSGFVGKKVICMQWQQDFVEWLGLNVTSSYAPPESLSTKDMLNITHAAQEQEVCLIIDNLQSGTTFGARVASECGASHVILTNLPGAVPGTNTYLRRITYNTNQLIEGIEAYEHGR